MFNCDALQQLKQDMHSSKEIAQGLVRGTSKRFGFVVLDDGREAFLNPDEMQRVFPGDRVEVSLSTNEQDKLEATLETLISSTLDEFVGRYIVRGKGHFVEPDMQGFNRWIFLAPKDRLDALSGDYIRVRIVRHPFKSEGKAQAKVLTRIGRDEDVAIEVKYTVDKFQLPFIFGEKATEAARELEGECFNAQGTRRDLTAIPFVTIDAESTLDMDDALYAESCPEGGWKLLVAIADPSSEIELGSPLELAARVRANSIYLPGNTITMLPKALSHQTFSLVAAKARPVLICEMNIADDGAINNFNFFEALIQSRQKLTYTGVAALLEQQQGQAEIDADAVSSLQTLSDLSYARTRYRQDHSLVMEDRPDYYPILDDKRKIERIEKCERTVAHALVEESMLATNACAGDFFAKNPGNGIFSTHAGFKPERLDEVKSLLKDDRPELAATLDLNTLDTLQSYQKLISSLQRSNANCVVLATLKRTLQPGKLSMDAQPHMGLGFTHYATITSPIRRYNDFYNHQAIKNIINGNPAQMLPEGSIEKLQQQITAGRQACRQMERWLYCQFMQQHIGKTLSGNVSLVTSAGLGIVLADFGIQGFCYLAADRNNRPKVDSRRMKLSHNQQDYYLEQKVEVLVESVDIEARKINLAFINPTLAA